MNISLSISTSDNHIILKTSWHYVKYMLIYIRLGLVYAAIYWERRPCNTRYTTYKVMRTKLKPLLECCRKTTVSKYSGSRNYKCINHSYFIFYRFASFVAYISEAIFLNEHNKTGLEERKHKIILKLNIPNFL